MAKKNALTWRVNDLVIASVLAVACGLIFWIWNNAVYPATKSLLVSAPEFMPLIGGAWLLAGVLGGYIIRKPGAALYCELLAAIVSALLGSSSVAEILLSGFIQGIGAELVFLIFLYRLWTLPVALLAGAVSGFFMGFSELIIYYAGEIVGGKAVIYVTCSVISGLVLAGLLSWVLTRALARTGVLSSLASGRAARQA